MPCNLIRLRNQPTNQRSVTHDSFRTGISLRKSVSSQLVRVAYSDTDCSDVISRFSAQSNHETYCISNLIKEFRWPEILPCRSMVSDKTGLKCTRTSSISRLHPCLTYVARSTFTGALAEVGVPSSDGLVFLFSWGEVRLESTRQVGTI